MDRESARRRACSLDVSLSSDDQARRFHRSERAELRGRYCGTAGEQERACRQAGRHGGLKLQCQPAEPRGSAARHFQHKGLAWKQERAAGEATRSQLKRRHDHRHGQRAGEMPPLRRLAHRREPAKSRIAAAWPEMQMRSMSYHEGGHLRRAAPKPRYADPRAGAGGAWRLASD